MSKAMKKPTSKATRERSAINYSTLRQEVLEKRPKVQAEIDNLSESNRWVLLLKSMRREAGITQRELAERTGWEQSYIARLESLGNKTVPSLKTMRRYSEACGTDLAIVAVTSEKKQKGKEALCISGSVALNPGRQSAVSAITETMECSFA